MKRFDEYSEFVRSVVQTLVALLATLAGIAVAAGYIWANVWLRPLAFQRKLLFGNVDVNPLELFALGFESFLICGATTLHVAGRLYRRIGALENARSIPGSKTEFNILVRVGAAILLVVMISAEFVTGADLKAGMVVRLLAIFVLFSPFHAHGGPKCNR